METPSKNTSDFNTRLLISKSKEKERWTLQPGPKSQESFFRLQQRVFIVPKKKYKTSSCKLYKQGHLMERLQSSFRKFYGRYGNLIQQFEVSLSRMFNDILTFDELQWLPNRSDFSSITWPGYRAWPSSNCECFPWGICNGFDILLKNAYPSGHLVPPFWWLAYALIVNTSFPELAMSFLDLHIEYPSVLFRFC